MKSTSLGFVAVGLALGAVLAAGPATAQSRQPAAPTVVADGTGSSGSAGGLAHMLICGSITAESCEANGGSSAVLGHLLGLF